MKKTPHPSARHSTPSKSGCHLLPQEKAIIPPGSTPIRCTTLTLQRKACEKEYEQKCPYSFCCRAGVNLPPFSLHLSFVFGDSKPPPYDFVGRQNLLYERLPLACFLLYRIFCSQLRRFSHSHIPGRVRRSVRTTSKAIFRRRWVS